jgi:hypothetical protein
VRAGRWLRVKAGRWPRAKAARWLKARAARWLKARRSGGVRRGLKARRRLGVLHRKRCVGWVVHDPPVAGVRHLDPRVGVLLTHAVEATAPLPLAACEADSDTRWDSHGPQEEGHGRGEVLAVAAARLQKRERRVAVRLELRAQRVAKARHEPQGGRDPLVRGVPRALQLSHQAPETRSPEQALRHLQVARRWGSRVVVAQGQTVGLHPTRTKCVAQKARGRRAA